MFEDAPTHTRGGGVSEGLSFPRCCNYSIAYAMHATIHRGKKQKPPYFYGDFY